MFQKFKDMVIETISQGEARFQVKQEQSRAMFRDPNETPEQIQQRLKEINAMIRPSPEELARQLARINAGIDPTYDQIMKQQSRYV